jgi:hypothetical protein
LAVPLGVNTELAVTDFGVHVGVKVPSRKADRTLRGFEMTRVNNSDRTGITGYTPYEFGFC